MGKDAPLCCDIYKVNKAGSRKEQWDKMAGCFTDTSQLDIELERSGQARMHRRKKREDESYLSVSIVFLSFACYFIILERTNNIE